MRLPTSPLAVSDEQRSVLEKLLRSHTAPYRDVQRARVLLMAADGFATTNRGGRAKALSSLSLRWRPVSVFQVAWLARSIRRSLQVGELRVPDPNPVAV